MIKTVYSYSTLINSEQVENVCVLYISGIIDVNTVLQKPCSSVRVNSYVAIIVELLSFSSKIKSTQMNCWNTSCSECCACFIYLLVSY